MRAVPAPGQKHHQAAVDGSGDGKYEIAISVQVIGREEIEFHGSHPRKRGIRA
jgi:hypothetical protein